MGKRHINARQKLWELQYDLKRMLEENEDTKNIKEIIEKKLERLKDGKYHKIDW